MMSSPVSRITIHDPCAAFLCVLLLCPLSISAATVNPWVTSDAKIYSDSAEPNIFSVEAFHDSPAFKGLPPKEFCRKFFDLYFDGRRKSWTDFNKGLTLWAHTAQEPRANANVIELDPILLLNVHGTGYCGIQSGLLNGVYFSRPGGEPGKPAIPARRWFLGGTVHSVCDAFYDGKWHYYDVDLGGFAGDDSKDVWSVADVIADPKGYYGAATTLKSKYFYGADAKGKWVESIDKSKSYCFQDNEMLGHEMTFVLHKGERFNRYFSKADAGWSETLPFTKPVADAVKGYCELIYEPTEADAASDAICKENGTNIFAVRCPYNITSSKVEGGGKATVSIDLGQTWTPLPQDGLVADAVNRWDYLLKVEGGSVKKITTHALLHPGALPRVGDAGTKFTVAQSAPYQTLTYIPDWSTAEKLAATAKVDGLQYKPSQNLNLNGGQLSGKGSVTIPVKAPPDCRIVKVSACVLGGAGTQAQSNNFLDLNIGAPGKEKLAGKSTDCSSWGTNPATKVDQWQNNVNGSATLEPCTLANVTIGVNGYGSIIGVRIYVHFIPNTPPAPTGTLTLTHGYDGKTFSKDIPAVDLEKGPVTYAIPDAAKANQFIKMQVH